MARWEPDSRGRLEQAAFALYGERGFERTTVAEIAKRAGLTERTFFRHFADKREVLFAGSAALQDLLASTVVDAAEGLAPIDAVGAAIEAAGAQLEERRERARQRHAIIAATAELRERELIKLASLAAALADALRQRGVDEPAASLTAEAGIAVFRIAVDRWVDEANQRTLPELVRDSFGQLRAVTAGR
jgi:AcrR family transcriptional regulator